MNAHTLLVGVQMSATVFGNLFIGIYKTRRHLAITLHIMYQEKCVHMGSRIRSITAALFIIAQNLKYLKYPSYNVTKYYSIFIQ